MHELKRLPLSLLLEPELPVRVAMDEEKLQELAESMRDNGLIMPIGVKPKGELYEIIHGHRRYTAAKSLDWKEIDCHVFADGDASAVAMMLHENLCREDISVAEEALYYSQLMEVLKLDTIGLAATVKKGRDYVEDRLRLLDGDELVFHALRERKIGFGVAREINKCKDAEGRAYILDTAIKHGSTMRSVADMVRNWNVSHGDAPAPTPAPAASTEAPAQQSYKLACFFCGGDKDPYNIDHVPIHRHCREHIEKVMAEATSE